MAEKNFPLVSIVVTTKNEEKNIGNCLESLKRQTYPREKIEIIVVDNNSTDRTKEIARKYTRKVYNKGPERSAQRNFGLMEKARGKYVMYLDADMILSRTVVEKAVRRLETDRNMQPTAAKYASRNMLLRDETNRNNAPSGLKYALAAQNMRRSREINRLVGLYIPEVVLGNSFWSKVRRFERSFYDGTVIDCVRFLRRDVFLQVGGFDLSMTGPEDWDLDKKIREVGRVAVLEGYDFEEINKKLRQIEIHRNNAPSELKYARFASEIHRRRRRNKNKWKYAACGCEINRNMLASRAKYAACGCEIERLINLTRAGVIFHNEAEFNLQKYLAKKSYYAQSFQKYKTKWGRDDPDVKKQFGFWYRYFGVFLENGKWRRLIRHPILALGMYFLRGMVGAVYLGEKYKSQISNIRNK